MPSRSKKPTCAILGASADRSKFSNQSLHAHELAGYEVYAVNPRGGEVEGRTAYTRLADVPVDRLDRISVYLRPSALLPVLDEIAAKGCDELWLNPGTSDDQVLARAQELGLNAIVGCSIVDVSQRGL